MPNLRQDKRRPGKRKPVITAPTAALATGDLIDLESERQQALALTWIFEGTQWLTAVEVASLANVGVATVKRWKQDRRVFAVSQAGREVYPRYAFDARFRPLAAVYEVLTVLADSSEMSVAAWFESTSSFLRGKRPRELAASAPDQVKAAAKNSLDLEKYPG